MNRDPILPRPVPMSQGLLRKWLGAEGASNFRGAWRVQAGRQMMVEAVEEAIRRQYPDGGYPPASELLDLERLTPEEEEAFRVGIEAFNAFLAQARGAQAGS